MKILIPTFLMFLVSLFEPLSMLPPGNDEAFLFRVPVDGKMGFINDRGEMIIPPTFQIAQEFAEGLCAVRVNGRYGFINNTGTLVIPAEFDYATQFVEGLALVYTNGKPQFITKLGTLAFPTVYARMAN